jgi:seryl-tRNA synthetase
MLQIHVLRENKDQIIDALTRRNHDFSSVIEEVLKTDSERRSTQVDLDNQLSEANKLAKEIGGLFKSGKAAEANELKSKTADLKQSSKVLQEKLQGLETKQQTLLYEIPNVPNPSVPKGKLDTDNEIVFESGIIPKLENAQPHWEITSKYDIIDFELGVKIAGAGFPVYKGKGARLQRALINFFLEEAINFGYTEIQPPLLVNEASGYGTGQLPDKEGQMYHCTTDDLYLIPTAEVPITNLFRNLIVDKNDFPIKYTGYTPCFRREAGSYGKDVRGLNRLHQFDKVEIVQVVHPSESYKVLDEMVEYVKSLLSKLELPFRVAKLCGGDLGFTSALTFDMEVYSAAQEKWLEVSSISNFETYQANRLKLRFKEDGKTQLAHTLNGSALALPRILAALLENNQTEKGIRIPKALQKHTGFEYID